MLDLDNKPGWLIICDKDFSGSVAAAALEAGPGRR